MSTTDLGKHDLHIH